MLIRDNDAIVTLSAIEPVAVEDELSTGVFQVERTDLDLIDSLTVAYIVTEDSRPRSRTRKKRA